MLKQPQEDGSQPKGHIAALSMTLVWIVWAVSSLYLIAWSAYYTFLSVAFTEYSLRAYVKPSLTEYIVSAAHGSLPLLVSVAIAVVGAILWRSARFRILGLLVISVEVILALIFLVDPAGLIDFFI